MRHWTVLDVAVAMIERLLAVLFCSRQEGSSCCHTMTQWPRIDRCSVQLMSRITWLSLRNPLAGPRDYWRVAVVTTPLRFVVTTAPPVRYMDRSGSRPPLSVLLKNAAPSERAFDSDGVPVTHLRTAARIWGRSAGIAIYCATLSRDCMAAVPPPPRRWWRRRL